MDLSGSSITWRGLTLYGRAGLGPFTFSTFEGWEDLPNPRQPDATPRPQSHGWFDSEVFSDERHVLASGRCFSLEARDALLVELQASFNFSAPDELPLTITHVGRTLTSYARLTRFKPTPLSWGVGYFGWAAEWVCSDPLRYGDPVSATTGFPAPAGGLEFDLYTDGTTDTGYLEYGEYGETGRVTITNTGNEDATIQYDIAGPVPAQGFEILLVGTGERLRFEGDVSSGSHLVIDSANGLVLIDGYADRSNLLTWRDWFVVPAGGSIEIAFVNSGSFSAAQLTASIRPGSW